MVIRFAAGLRYIVGRGFVQSGRDLDLEQVAPLLRRLWEDEDGRGTHWAHKRKARTRREVPA